MGEDKYLSFEECCRKKDPDLYHRIKKLILNNRNIGDFRDFTYLCLKEEHSDLLDKLREKYPSFIFDEEISKLKDLLMKTAKTKNKLELIAKIKNCIDLTEEEKRRIIYNEEKRLYELLDGEVKKKYPLDTFRYLIPKFNLGVIKYNRSYSSNNHSDNGSNRGYTIEEILKIDSRILDSEREIRRRYLFQQSLEGLDTLSLEEAKENVGRRIEILRKISKKS